MPSSIHNESMPLFNETIVNSKIKEAKTNDEFTLLKPPNTFYSSENITYIKAKKPEKIKVKVISWEK